MIEVVKNLSLETHVDLAKEAGFAAAAGEAIRIADRARRLAQAYEHFRYVSEEKVQAFQARLRASTSSLNDHQRAMIAQHRGAHIETYDRLAFMPVEQYAKMPPSDVLMAVKAAKDRAIFDTFEVAAIETTREVHDPIVFGRITDCGDRFFVSQWGEDVKITDLIGENEG